MTSRRSRAHLFGNCGFVQHSEALQIQHLTVNLLPLSSTSVVKGHGSLRLFSGAVQLLGRPILGSLLQILRLCELADRGIPTVGTSRLVVRMGDR
jgi:hypothetical protein